MTARIKQWESEGPECNLCFVTIKHDGFYLEFLGGCSHGSPYKIRICEKCLDEQHKNLLGKKEGKKSSEVCVNCSSLASFACCRCGTSWE